MFGLQYPCKRQSLKYIIAKYIKRTSCMMLQNTKYKTHSYANCCIAGTSLHIYTLVIKIKIKFREP